MAIDVLPSRTAHHERARIPRDGPLPEDRAA